MFSFLFDESDVNRRMSVLFFCVLISEGVIFVSGLVYYFLSLFFSALSLGSSETSESSGFIFL